MPGESDAQQLPENTVDLVAWALDQLAHTKKSQPVSCSAKVFVHGSTAILDSKTFLERVCLYSRCGEWALPYALCLLRKAQNAGETDLVTRTTVRLAFFGCLVLACKVLHDNTRSMASFAQMAGVPCEQLVSMEHLLLRVLRYRVLVPRSDIEHTVATLADLRANNPGKALSSVVPMLKARRCARVVSAILAAPPAAGVGQAGCVLDAKTRVTLHP